MVGTDDGYLLQSVSTGLYLTAGDADTALDRYNVTVGDPGPGVFWDLVDLGDGTYRIYNIETNRFLDADRRNDFNVDTSTQERPDTAWQLVAIDGPTADDDALGAAFVQTNDLDNNADTSQAEVIVDAERNKVVAASVNGEQELLILGNNK